MNCTLTELPRSACQPSDGACICNDVALQAALGACIAQNCSVVDSLRQDIWRVTPDNITQILLVGSSESCHDMARLTDLSLKLFFVEELLYAFVVSVTKVSVLIFYLRLFPEPWFRVACYLTLTITTLYGLGQSFAIILICSPVSFNWTQWDREHPGQCGDINVMTFTNGGINITIDLILFILPVTQFITVSWTLQKKIGISLIFLIGLL
ncbi:hypothetical protein CCHL11_02495 [Colletotrichum chlorophyti]|uniref:Rhodopsin domain-containing protein n=1 Tax=Colletotrichum chlorophyti TaxID=708187 RepID=A0A1Q8S8Z1_9PEZI|nr:hypothetical protein CCHL11_02495 [Colletotrichum chlorophyti]